MFVGSNMWETLTNVADAFLLPFIAREAIKGEEIGNIYIAVCLFGELCTYLNEI
jgi:hypothetical protein